jgi:beta-N-acetylhexosaminidase
VPTNVIVGCSSTQLSDNERALFSELQPWGIILFARNIDNPKQITALIEDCKKTMQRNDLMVFIDQEGGRVSRLPKAHWRIPPSPTVFANMYDHNQQSAIRACLLNATLIGLELKALGINANCAPMLDIPQEDASSIISERALGAAPHKVIELGKQISKGLKRTGVAPVIKHMPGHGRATSDSHLELPYVSASLTELTDWDFIPFKALNDEAMAMTAHIVFHQVDRDLPATISAKVVNTIMREIIGFDGLIMTDDINMHALSGTVASRAEQAIAAGCDIVLHCSGKMDEMKSLLKVASHIDGKTLQRVEVAQKIAFKGESDISAVEIQKELEYLLKSYL